MGTIKTRHAIAIGVLFSIGSLIISLGSDNRYLWQTLVISFFLSLIILYVYQRLLINYPNMTIFEIIKLKYNNIIGKIVIILYMLYLLYISVTIIYTFIDFITTINQSDFLSKEFIMLINMILLGYVLKTSLENIARFSQVSFIVIVIMIILLFLAGFTDIDIQNLYPLTIPKNNNTIQNIFNLIVQPFVEMTILFNVFCKMKNNKVKKNIFFITSFISLIFLLVISIETIGLLGKDYSQYLNFPYYSSISSIDMSKIVIKIETLSLIIIYFSSFIKLVFVLHSLISGFNSITNLKRKYYYPFILLIHVFAMVAFNNIYELKQLKYYYNYYAIFLRILIPLLIFIKAKPKDNKNIIVTV